MASEKLTQSLLSNYPRPTAGTVRIRDTGIRGLYAYVGVKSISFVLRREVDGVTKPLKLGEFPAMTVMQAREAAEKANTQINTTGAVAISSAIAKRSAPTLKTALDDYIRIR
ncbi:MAG: Arm DNA-binding domain, partial [Proteobacteria bacterium]|nr:Arm DNA-binding domain [Pseudomonadota bacterium]